MRLVLASSSSSRKLLLAKLGLPFEVIRPNIDETVLPGEEPNEHVLRLAVAKANAVAAKAPNALIIGCDSVCFLGHEIVSKPETHAEAVRQLRLASGQTVGFYSGLCLLNTTTHHQQSALEITSVQYKVLSDDQIERYLRKDQPYQCAGSIKAEGLGIVLLDKMVSDDPNSLIGLPLLKLIAMLEQEGLDLLA